MPRMLSSKKHYHCTTRPWLGIEQVPSEFPATLFRNPQGVNGTAFTFEFKGVFLGAVGREKVAKIAKSECSGDHIDHTVDDMPMS